MDILHESAKYQNAINVIIMAELKTENPDLDFIDQLRQRSNAAIRLVYPDIEILSLKDMIEKANTINI